MNLEKNQESLAARDNFVFFYTLAALFLILYDLFQLFLVSIKAFERVVYV